MLCAAQSHMDMIAELNTLLAAKQTPEGGGFAINNNEARAGNQTIAMLEDFAASEHCITVLQEVVARGLGVQAHAGDLPDGAGPSSEPNACENGDINAMAAFLIGAGEYSYYHCASTWSSDPRWPSVPDVWLDWLPEYDRKLGEPAADGAKGADGVWTRSFAAGTKVAFDPAFNNGTIWWADGTVSKGPVGNATDRQSSAAGPPPGGCSWITL